MGGPISAEDRGGTGGIDEISLSPSAHNTLDFSRSVSLIMQTAVILLYQLGKGSKGFAGASSARF